MSSRYFPALTGIRAMAAGLVVFHHTFIGFFKNPYLDAVIHELYIGVNLFFVLSGFLIWYRYSPEFLKNEAWLRPYLINRLARVYPLYFILTTITLLITFFAHNLNMNQFLLRYFLNISFLNSLSSEFVYSGIPQGWTLGVEAFFYCSLPLIFYLKLKRKINLFFIAAMFFSCGHLLYLGLKEVNLFHFLSNFKYVRITTIFGRIFEFTWGILLAQYMLSRTPSKPTFRFHTSLGALFILLSVLVIFPALQGNHEFSIQGTLGYLFGVIVFPFFVVMLFYGLIFESSKLKDFLASRPLLLLGQSSYALYLFHGGIIATVIEAFLGKNHILLILVYYTGSIVLWRFVEKPLNKFLKVRLK